MAAVSSWLHCGEEVQGVKGDSKQKALHICTKSSKDRINKRVKNSFHLVMDIDVEVAIRKQGSPVNPDIEQVTALSGSSTFPWSHPQEKGKRGSEPSQVTNQAS